MKTFIGFRNFLDMAQDTVWWNSIVHAGYITLIALTFQNALAFALALACDREIKMKNFYRVVFFIPPVLSEMVVGYIWQWILDPNMQNGQYVGVLNFILAKLGLLNLIHSWLSDPNTVLTCIAVIHSWKGFGWGFIMLLAGLQTIDKQLYEAAKVDGAGAWSTFMNVTVPMMLPVIMVVVILTILGSMQAFVLIISLVSQGLAGYTEVPVTEILGSMNGNKQFGYACAQAMVFGLILVVSSFLLKKVSDKMKQA
ncbi:MAG: sugar ABC transporter permease [Candidatus Omnitrophica bacterium]|nr:sugar ABC transporter permease [Candidatus Omnitrophota bacterium]